MNITVGMLKREVQERRREMRKYMVVSMGLVLVLGLTQGLAFADRGDGHGPGRHRQRAIGEKFLRTLKMLHLHQDELNVSDEQLDKIRVLKHDLNKQMIRTKAEVDIISMDIRALLYRDEVNVKEANNLIDRKYDIKKEKTKRIIGAFAELKKILTTEQIDKLENIERERLRVRNPEGPPGMGFRGKFGG